MDEELKKKNVTLLLEKNYLFEFDTKTRLNAFNLFEIETFFFF